MSRSLYHQSQVRYQPSSPSPLMARRPRHATLPRIEPNAIGRVRCSTIGLDSPSRLAGQLEIFGKTLNESALRIFVFGHQNGSLNTSSERSLSGKTKSSLEHGSSQRRYIDPKLSIDRMDSSVRNLLLRSQLTRVQSAVLVVNCQHESHLVRRELSGTRTINSRTKESL